jgi:hypothetical protein
MNSLRQKIKFSFPPSGLTDREFTNNNIKKITTIIKIINE